MEENKKVHKIVKRSIGFFIIILILAVTCSIMLKYNVEGEQNMPFNLSRVFVVSSAEGIKKEEENDSNWNVEIYQTNEIYLNITKNKNYKEAEIIKSIQLRNIRIDSNPQIGEIEIFIPKDEDEKVEYKEENRIYDNIEYVGDIKSDIGNLKISNQGGTLILSVINKTGKSYNSDDDELKHDGTLIAKANLKNEEIKFKISFDVVIKLESGVTYTGRINLDLPIENVESEGITKLDKTETKDIIFKRD